MTVFVFYVSGVESLNLMGDTKKKNAVRHRYMLAASANIPVFFYSEIKKKLSDAATHYSQ